MEFYLLQRNIEQFKIELKMLNPLGLKQNCRLVKPSKASKPNYNI